MAELARSLEAAFSAYAGAPAHRLGASVISYAELDRLSSVVAGFLVKNVPRGEPVMIVGEREHEFLGFLLGCLKAGNPYVPAGELIPLQRSLAMAGAAGCRHVLSVDGAAGFPRSAGIAIHGPEDFRGHNPVAGWDRCARGDEIVYILFTSGSTGVPKGVKVSAGNIESFLSWTSPQFGYAERPLAFLNQAPFHFDLSVYELYNALTTGGSLLSLPGRSAKDPELLFQRLFEYATFTQVWVSTPSFLRYCITHPEFADTTFTLLEQFVLIGEVFPVELARETRQRFPRAKILNFYGPTEATVAHTVFEVTSESLEGKDQLPVGKAKPGGFVEIDDGEIVLSGANVAWGYVNDPGETDRKFSESGGMRRYRTGDLGTIDSNGCLWFRGRIDSQVKVNGYRVELGEIERVLGTMPGISATCVMLEKPSDGDSPWIVAFVQTANAEPEIDFRKKLKTFLADQLPGYMIPKRFIRVTEMPLNRNGKLDRDRLKELL
ncbi:MAG: AMP-binding protein [Bdellovibrionota bacterium]